jgi:hypothetical protein
MTIILFTADPAILTAVLVQDFQAARQARRKTVPQSLPGHPPPPQQAQSLLEHPPQQQAQSLLEHPPPPQAQSLLEHPPPQQ